MLGCLRGELGERSLAGKDSGGGMWEITAVLYLSQILSTENENVSKNIVKKKRNVTFPSNAHEFAFNFADFLAILLKFTIHLAGNLAHFS